MLLATATPVQLYPIEAYDILDILAKGNPHVLGDEFSFWRRQSKTRSLSLVQDLEDPPKDFMDRWDWMRIHFLLQLKIWLLKRSGEALNKKPYDYLA